MEAEVAELKSKAVLYESQIECKSQALSEEREQSKLKIAQDREMIMRLTYAISELQTATADKESAIQMKDTSMKRKDSELESTNRALEEKDATISAGGGVGGGGRVHCKN